MADHADRRRVRGRPRVLVLVTGAVLLALSLASPAALALQDRTFDHDGARCGFGCHTGASGTSVPGRSAECEVCHTGFMRRGGASHDCWMCHRPGQGMAASQSQAGCTGLCHFYAPATDGYTDDRTPHGAAPHYAAALRDCTSCHGVATAATVPDGSPHHDVADQTAPTDSSCLACHNEPPVTDLMSWHGDLKTGGDAGECRLCHVGMSASHPSASAMVAPELAATAAMAGADVVVWGSLLAGRTGLADVPGWVQWRGPSDTDDWDAAQETSVTTAADGTYMVTISASGLDAQFRVIFEGALAGTTPYRPRMAPAFWKSTLTMSLAGLRGGVLRFGKSLTVKGTVRPTFPGRQTEVTFQRKAGARWSSVKTILAAIDPKSGVYGCAYKPLKRGSWRVRAYVPPMKSYKGIANSWREFAVR